MTFVTKRKHVTHELFNDMVLPEPPKFIARITEPRGNNLHAVETETGDRFLVSMTTKYRKHIWVKRGMYVLCEPIAEGDKVKAEIFRVLLEDNIRYIYEHGMWPSVFPLPPKVIRRNISLSEFMPSSESSSDQDSEENEASVENNVEGGERNSEPA